jgi:hypothetical protein
MYFIPEAHYPNYYKILAVTEHCWCLIPPHNLIQFTLVFTNFRQTFITQIKSDKTLTLSTEEKLNIGIKHYKTKNLFISSQY